MEIGQASQSKFRLFSLQGLDLEEDVADDTIVKLSVVLFHKQFASNDSDVFRQQFETEQVIIFALVEDGE